MIALNAWGKAKNFQSKEHWPVSCKVIFNVKCKKEKKKSKKNYISRIEPTELKSDLIIMARTSNVEF